MLNKIASSPLRNFTKYFLFPSSLLITLFFALGIQGSPFSKHVQAEGEIEIHTQEDLAAITDAPNASYILMANIDLAEHSDFYIPTFGGVFDGNGFEISHLTLSLGPLVEKAGLFGELSAGGTIKNLGVVDINITGGKQYIGGIVGYNYGTVTNSYTTGIIDGSAERVGGVIGFNMEGTLSDSYSTATITGSEAIGGLIGWSQNGEITDSHWEGIIGGSSYYIGGLIGFDEGGIITNCYTRGEVDSTGDYVGGLIGYHTSSMQEIVGSGVVQSSYSEATVTGSNAVGGLLGILEGDPTSIIKSYATGSVTGEYYVGGLVGKSYGDSIIETSFASGNVTGNDEVGGLVGENDCLSITNSYALGNVTETSGDGGEIGGLIGYHYGGIINNCYSAGEISSLLVVEGDVGGLIGYNWGESDVITNSFWDTETSTITISLGGTGKTTAQMKSISTFNDTATEGLNATWDIVEYKSFNPPASNIWFIEDTFDYAHLYYEYEDYVPSQQGGDPEITTSPATNVTSTSAKLNALLTDLGTYNTVYVYFRYKAASEGIWIESSQVDKALTGSYSYELMSLIPETIYQYSSAANFGETGVVYGDTLSFTTIASAVEEPPVDEPPAVVPPVIVPPVIVPPVIVPPVIVPPVVEPPVDVPPEETFEPIKDCTNADETITVNVGDTFKLSITFGSGSPYRPYSPGYDSNVLKLLDYSDITEEQKTSPNSGIAPITIGGLMQRVYTFEAISLTDNTCTLVELGLSHVHDQADKKEKKIIAVFINDGIIGDGTPPDDDSSVEEDPLPPEDEGENIFTKIGRGIRKFAEKTVKTI
ncbi:MAG: hypothetical protein M0P32_09385, partial [Bacteroidales bacterium]|nr:hypothetical protein [Bacteroidales bacterium]